MEIQTTSWRFPIRRLSLFEFCDQVWLRGWLREAYMDCLNATLQVFGTYSRMHKPFFEWASHMGAHEVIDLASGGAGPVETIVRGAEREGLKLPRVVLSDLFPQSMRYELLQEKYGGERIGVAAGPVSAVSPDQYRGHPRMICSAFHHFTPVLARHIVADAIEHSPGIFIIEPVERRISQLLILLLGGPLFGMAAVALSGRMCWRNVVFCLLFPLVPLLMQFDGIVSAFRAYTGEEIASMVPEKFRTEVELRWGRQVIFGIWGVSFFYAYRQVDY